MLFTMVDKSTYCSLSTSAWDDRSKKMCCFAILPKYKNYKEMHNDNTVKQLVNDLQNGIRSPTCKPCWAMEDDGIFSMRQQSLQNEGLPKTNDFLQQELQDKKLKYLILDSGIQCNFACRTCGPWSSTGHHKEWAEKNRGWIWKTDNVDLESLLKQDLSNVKNIEVLGGEPFTNLDHLKVIDKLKNSQPYWLTYTTNGSVRLRKEILELSHACGYEHPCQFTGNDIEFSSGVNVFSTLDDIMGYKKVEVPFDSMEKLFSTQ